MENLDRYSNRRITALEVFEFMVLTGNLFQEFANYADVVADCINFVSSDSYHIAY